MAIEEHLSEYAGQPVVAWEPEAGPPLARGTAYWLGLSYEEAEAGGRWTDKLAAFLDEPGVGEVSGRRWSTWSCGWASGSMAARHGWRIWRRSSPGTCSRGCDTLDCVTVRSRTRLRRR